MNSKAIKRQLLAAIAMVLVAALALGSSTYAWFVASGTVTAEGMNVQAQSEGGLAISVNKTAWGTSANANVSNVKLLPTSTNNLTNWYHAMASKADSPTADEQTRTVVTDSIFDSTTKVYKGNTNGYIVLQEFWIRATGTTDSVVKGLYVSDVKATGSAVQMSTALRVGIRCSTDNGSNFTDAFIFGPVDINSEGQSDSGNRASDNYKVYSAANTVAGTVKLKKATQEDATLVSRDTIITTDTNSPVKVQVFIWYEGEDQNLTSAKYDASSLSVTVEFSCIEGGYKAPTQSGTGA